MPTATEPRRQSGTTHSESASVCNSGLDESRLARVGRTISRLGRGFGRGHGAYHPGLWFVSFVTIAHPSDLLVRSRIVEKAVTMTTLNLSHRDGVANSARRRPDSQPLLRVLVGNKYVVTRTSIINNTSSGNH